MQAKQPNKDRFDQQFEDYAWSQMNVLLDQEMPVREEKKRRWLLWLFLFLGLSVSGAIAYQVFQGEHKVKIERPIAESKKESEDNEQATIKNEQTKGENSEVRSQVEDIKSRELSVESRDELVVKIEDLSKKDNNYSNNNQTILNRLEQDQTNSNKIKQNQAVRHRQEENSNVVYNNSSNRTPSSNTQITDIELPIAKSLASENQAFNPSILHPFNPLPTVHSMNISPIESITSATRSITTEPIVRKISKWELATRLGGIATLNGETHLSLGTDMQYHFQPKWSLRSGVRWVVGQDSPLFSLSEADEASLDLEMIDTTGSSIRTTGVGNYSTEADKTAFQDSIIRTDSPKHHFIRIPLSLEYRLSNRLAVFGGVEVLMPLSKKESSSDLANNVGVFVTTSNPNTDNSILDSENTFIRPSWQWHTGVHFRASQRFSFDFSYHHILPKQSGRNHLEQYMELGLRYNIFSP